MVTGEGLGIPDREYAMRVEAVREACRIRGLDALLAYGAHRDYQPADLRYLARWYCVEEETSWVLIPADGLSTLITDAPWDVDRAHAEAYADAITLAVDPGADLAALIRRELGERPRVGIAGFHFFPAPTFRALTNELPLASFEDASELTAELRMVKSVAELELMRAASHISDQAMSAGLELIKEGNAEVEVAAAAEAVIRAAGAEPSFVTEMGAGPRTALGTFLPGWRRFQRGELAVLDCGARLQGYHGDMCRTRVIGEPNDRQRAMLEAVEHAVIVAIKAVKPGVTVGAIRDAAAGAIREAGYGDHWWDAFMPHGNGVGQHEAPNANQHPLLPLRPGMVLCIEPGITLSDQGAVIIEQMIAVTDDGAEVLNRLPTNIWDR